MIADAKIAEDSSKSARFRQNSAVILDDPAGIGQAVAFFTLEQLVNHFYLGQRLSSTAHKRGRAARFHSTTKDGTTMTELSRLPGPVMDLWEWQYQGSCRDVDDTLFFHPEGERGAARRRRAEAAKAICHGCPVMLQCREQSLAVREPYGVWGGLSEDERSAVLAERSSLSQRRIG